ncbi:hypothetical protein LTR84_004997 [Exophiala bonariae]|uniref:NmrA-like domain-containing protein n=1 Tax=Exophiala bonariae TaxID=1690606 RepID=A0AAV9NNF9_9EURO|nr:hypothetical protein LTR84_004997 [Exophiala bonariae]
MKVSVAGTGNVAQYLIEEIPKYGHELVVLTRKEKPGKIYTQRATDYSLASLISILDDLGVEALVSTIADFENPPVATRIHFDMLEACKQSKICKSYIPSEWTCDVLNYPEQPMFLAEANKKLHDALKQSQDIRWTIFANSWFMDYIVPASQRYLRDIGALWPMDHTTKVFTIYGPGDQLFSVCSVRDAAKAIAALLGTSEPWDPYTFVAGDHITLSGLFSAMKRRDPSWKSKTKSLAETLKPIIENTSSEAAMLSYFELLIYSGASNLPRAEVLRQRTKYFPNLHFQTVEELLSLAEAHPGTIV